MKSETNAVENLNDKPKYSPAVQYLDRSHSERSRVRELWKKDAGDLLMAHEFAFSAIASMINRVAGIKFEKQSKDVEGKMSLTAQFVQGIDICEVAISEGLYSQADFRSSQYAVESAQRQRVTQIQRILKHLNKRERWIIIGRFGLGRGREAQTLEQIGAGMGLSKERIRQLQARAMNKLRLATQVERISRPVSS